MQVEIDALEFDEWNAAEAARHGVTEAEICQVLEEAPVFLPNKRPHRAPVVMIGPTFGGRYLTVPLDPTPLPNVWRPASAWDSADGELARYHAVRRRV